MSAMSSEGKTVFSGWGNPIGTKGFEFIAFASPDAEAMAKQIEQLGFVAVAKHKSQAITLYQQGKVKLLLNADSTGFAADFAKQHGPCAYAMGFQVEEADSAYTKLLAKGAEAFDTTLDSAALTVPAISGIGNSILFLIDSPSYLHDFQFMSDVDSAGVGLTYLDHVTHNVYQGNMDQWAGFYEKLFNFKEIRYFDIEGKLTGLKSRAMTSPCGQIRIPINESSDDKSQIEEYLQEYQGEGIQHIALGTNNIYNSVSALQENGVGFLSVPDTYYEQINDRVTGHQENIAELQKRKILIDGAPTKNQGLLLQIFTKNFFGPIFFEIIQRKGNEGFGEGNFTALFESIELDQIRRGILTTDNAE